ncbi:hypothetical protein [Anianabacter salinae]|nr:hypothetical protein [Anianabacter salinae]
MQTLKRKFPGVVLVADLNWDRLLTVAAVVSALVAGAQLGQL